jgi:hypothetical protein
MSANYRQIVSGPRWAGLSACIKNTAWTLGLELTIDAEKRWLTETVRFEVRGETEAVKRFIAGLESSIRAYNAEIKKP